MGTVPIRFGQISTRLAVDGRLWYNVRHIFQEKGRNRAMAGRTTVVVCAAFAAAAAFGLFADVPWMWDDSARPAPSTSTGVRTVAQLESKGGGSGVSAAYGSVSAPFESRFTSSGSTSGHVLNSKPLVSLTITFK